jgi:hypothetical protein
VLFFICITRVESTSSHSFENSISQRIARLRIKLPRYNGKLEKIPADFNPTSVNYWMSIFWISLLGIIITVIALLFSLLWTPLRQCNLCGGYEPTEGFFSCRKPERRRPYNKYEVLFMKLFFIILFVLAFLACTVSAIGNQWFNSHFINAADTLEQTASETLNRTEEMFIILSSSDLISANTGTSLQSLNNTQIEVTSLVNDMKRFNEMRYVFLWIILVFVVLANLLAVVSGLLQAKSFSESAGKIAWYTLVSVWFLFTAHFALTVVAGDACYDLDSYMQYKENGSMGTYAGESQQSTALTTIRSILDLVANCSEANGTLVPSLDISNSEIDSLVQDLNTYLDNEDPSGKGNYSFTFQTMYEALNISWVKNNSRIYGTVQNLTNVIQDLSELGQLNNCSFLADGYTTIRNESCVGVLSASYLLWISFLVISVVMTFTAFLTGMSYKRFRKRAYVIIKPEDNMGKSSIHLKV